MIKVCMFDIGGVVDAFNGDEMEKKLLRYFGVTDYDTFFSLAPALRPISRDFSAGLFDEEEYWKRFRAVTGVNVPDEPHLYTKYFNPIQNLATLAVIKDLKQHGVRVIAGTNVEPSHHIWHNEHNDYAIFDHTYTSDCLHAVKPEKEFFTKILDAESLQPSEVFFTDNAQENIDVAKKLGLNCHLFTSPETLRRHLVEMGIL